MNARKNTNDKSENSTIKGKKINEPKQCRLAPFNRDDLILIKRIEEGKEKGYIQYIDLETSETLFEQSIPILYEELCICGLDAVFDAIPRGGGQSLDADFDIRSIFSCIIVADRSNFDTLLKYSSRLTKKDMYKFVWLVLYALNNVLVDTHVNTYFVILILYIVP